MASGTRLESEAQREVLRYLKHHPSWAYVIRVNANGLGHKGKPDIIACLRGDFVAIETKREHGGAYGVTQPQDIERRKIERAGGTWFVVDGVKDLKSKLYDLWG